MPVLRNAKVIRALLACLLLGAVGTAAAVTRDVRMHGPNGNGGGHCPDATTAPTSAAPTKTSPTTVHGSKTKPVISIHSGGGGDGDDGSSHAPRWHSFLPGMFR